jgi:hypothetical protein
MGCLVVYAMLFDWILQGFERCWRCRSFVEYIPYKFKICHLNLIFMTLDLYKIHWLIEFKFMNFCTSKEAKSLGSDCNRFAHLPELHPKVEAPNPATYFPFKLAIMHWLHKHWSHKHWSHKHWLNHSKNFKCNSFELKEPRCQQSTMSTRCLGRFFGMVRETPSVSKSNQLYVVILQFYLLFLRCIS